MNNSVSVVLPTDVVSKLITSLNDTVDDLRRENEYLAKKVNDYEMEKRTKTTKKRGYRYNPTAAKFAGNIARLPKDVADQARAIATSSGYDAAIQWVKDWRATQN